MAAAQDLAGRTPQAAGEIRHLPVAAPWTTRQIIGLVYELAGQRPRILAAGPPTLRLLGLLKPAMREYLHTLLHLTDRWVVDDNKFRAAFSHPPPRSMLRLATSLVVARPPSFLHATA